MVEFEWDPSKARANLRKHRVSFGEAAAVFLDPLSITISDPEHSAVEDRHITIGASRTGRLRLVAPADCGDRIRIISARQLTRSERRDYEAEIRRRQA